ncbi:MAG: hypothetical protein GTN38_02375 [Candidatus Aenigmarchaeota archaeon]|nr:hypothetical protein [Candidatus Aenigmarchaeota archaeon]NIP40399.1 hypothetical protein [Candidatus Aenigmarchaeota archaeon]NIQ18325.1 hypothetical protein [Candidatus Aenigmarchaeota archaeon]NIS73277.1 hypothetical protein [Candidatus Aenigmarchaeota archaeon]
MRTRSKIDGVILITFLVGVISIVYFVTTIFLLGSDPTFAGVQESYLSWMIMERLILVGVIIIVLILISYILLRQKGTEELHRARPEEKAKRMRSEKELKEDIRRYYRDLGALKIVLKDGVMDAKTYNERKKYLEDMIKRRKKQLENLNS